MAASDVISVCLLCKDEDLVEDVVFHQRRLAASAITADSHRLLSRQEAFKHEANSDCFYRWNIDVLQDSCSLRLLLVR
jgi:hypothetical protein